MNPKPPENGGMKIRANQILETGFADKVRPLFVVGCPRSGTTAFADYLNQHPEILVCQERYRGVPTAEVTRDLFSFERILDFKPRERQRPPGGDLELHVKRHAEALARKDPAQLKWIGDKGPWYVRSLDLLATNNPGTRFIVLYRPIEEVAESWDARAKNPDHPWPSNRGAEVAVEVWNLALRKVREFIVSNPTPRVLIVNYHDFFYRNEAVVPLISRFLGLEFDESVTKSWRVASGEFESRRRLKSPLSKEQRSLIQEHADHAAEAWVLDRIEKQPREPGLYIEESIEAALDSLNEVEARAWSLQQRVKTLEHNLAQERQQARRLKKKMRQLKVHEQNLQGLKGRRRLLKRLNRIRAGVVRKLRRES